MLRTSIVLLALMLPTAFAQAQNTHTSCYRIGNMVNCDTTGPVQLLQHPPSSFTPSPPVDTAAAFQQGLAIRQQFEAKETREQAERDKRYAELIQRRVGDMLSEGDCAGAIDYA